jgi:long-subunit acyl-CoA synthetase (AMP-forming)
MNDKIWHGVGELPFYQQNLALMLNNNVERFSNKPVYQEVRGTEYVPLTWNQLQKNVSAIQASLQSLGFHAGDHLAVSSHNREEMLELEFAVMSMGAVFIPIFPGYPAEQTNRLVKFCEPKFVAVSDDDQYQKLENPNDFKAIIHFDEIDNTSNANCVSIKTLLNTNPTSSDIQGESVDPDTISLMMYTSGTMGKPKCVMLTHNNILSQQAAMKSLWSLNSDDRFLSYLPWHHSFGGIYEKYSAITNGAVLSLEHSFGKNIDILLDNWKKVKPTTFFSVPKIYQEIITFCMQNTEIEKQFFHKDLRFIFTAAAPLPKNISDMFEKRNIPIYEGWGLTETSPCCTVTDPKVLRASGIVGKPITGVSLTLSDENEIMVKGSNVMKGYYNNPEETQRVLNEDGWFYTGDVGEFEETGLRLISRKDRIFKLSNAEKVVPTEIENLIVKDCPYLSHAYVAGSGYDHPIILLFPNKQLLSGKSKITDIKEGCDCPKGCEDFAFCLSRCVKKMNDSLEKKYARVKKAMLLDYELSIENEELTPSMKLAPNVVAKAFKANIDYLYGDRDDIIDGDKIYLIDLE